MRVDAGGGRLKRPRGGKCVAQQVTYYCASAFPDLKVGKGGLPPLRYPTGHLILWKYSPDLKVGKGGLPPLRYPTGHLILWKYSPDLKVGKGGLPPLRYPTGHLLLCKRLPPSQSWEGLLSTP